MQTAGEVHRLSREEAARGYPVHLRAIVTYFDPELNDLPDLFVHDATGGIFVEFGAPPHLDLQAGDVVEIRGVTGPGEFAPVVRQPQVRAVGESALPAKAIQATFAQLLSGSLDGQWVEIEGLVHALHFTQTNVTLDLATLDGSVRATTRREPGENYNALIDSLVRVHGNAAPVLNWKQQMVGVQIFFPSLREIDVMGAAPADPFSAPVVPLANLMRFSPSREIPHRAHVQGTVTLQWPGRTLCVQQQGSSLCMDTAQQDRLNLGALVDAAGFPAIHGYKRTLENATFRIVSPGAPVRPMSITAEQALSGKYDGELVQIEGRLVGREHSLDEIQLMVRSGAILVPALLPVELAGRGAMDWKDGSLLRLTGICDSSASDETWRLRDGQVQPGAVQILLRSAEDVQVLRSPSWWSAQHALVVLLIAAAFALAFLAWIVVLRRRVEQQTKALRESEDRLRHLSEHDALTGLPNRLLLNERLAMAVIRAQRFEGGLGVLMLDLDGFKEINDLYGHQAGDTVLIETARRVLQVVRLTDTVARIGGDEFIVLLCDLGDSREAESIAAKIVMTVSSPIDLGGVAVSVTVSVGVCMYPQGGADPRSLLHNVDASMYAAKARGKNAFQVYSPAEL